MHFDHLKHNFIPFAWIKMALWSIRGRITNQCCFTWYGWITKMYKIYGKLNGFHGVNIKIIFLVCSYFTQYLSTLFYSKCFYAVYIICLTSDIKCHLFQCLTYIHPSTMIRPFEGITIHHTFVVLSLFYSKLMNASL